jgi:hypothetical protein
MTTDHPSWRERIAGLFGVPAYLVPDPDATRIHIALHSNPTHTTEPALPASGYSVYHDGHHTYTGTAPAAGETITWHPQWGEPLNTPANPETTMPDGERDWSRYVGNNIPTTERDSRLAETRCVWCGTPIPDTAADDLFCGAAHFEAWQRAQADLKSGGVSVQRHVAWSIEPPDAPPPDWYGCPAL